MAQLLVDGVQFTAAKPFDVRLTGDEERRFLESTLTLAELRIFSSGRSDGIHHLRVLLSKCCDRVVLPRPRNGHATEIVSMCPDAVEEEHTYNDTIIPSRV